MNPRDFIFNGIKASDMGLMLCSFDSDGIGVTQGGNIEPIVAKAPNRNKQNWFGYQFNTPLSWEFSLCKDVCRTVSQEDMAFTYDEEREIIRWLMHTDNWKWASFEEDRISRTIDVDYSYDYELEPSSLKYIFTISYLDYGKNIFITPTNGSTFAGDVYLICDDVKIFGESMRDGSKMFDVSNCRHDLSLYMMNASPLTMTYNIHSKGKKNVFEQLNYQAYCNVTPHQIQGKTIGYDVVMTSNSPFGYSDEVEQTITINNSTPATIDISSDLDIVYPNVEISALQDCYIYNENDLEQSENIRTELKNVNGLKIILDSENDIVYGLENPDDFNYNFLHLVDGINTFVTDSTEQVVLKFKYREVRRVLI